MHTPALEGDDLAPRVVLGGVLGQLFGDAKQALAPLGTAPARAELTAIADALL